MKCQQILRLSSKSGNKTARVFVQRWQADTLEQEEGVGSVQSKHKHSDLFNNHSLALESAWHFGLAWMQDLKGEDQANALGHQKIEKMNQNLLKFLNSQSKHFEAVSSIRDTQVGY